MHRRKTNGRRPRFRRHDHSVAPTLGTMEDGLEPVIDALRAAERDLRQERIDRAWVDLDIAALRLARKGSEPGAAGPVIDRAIGAVERARDLLGRAQVAQATTLIAGAVMMLTG